MISIEMTRDYKEHEPKILWGLTMRQIKFVGIALLVAILLINVLPGSFTFRLIVSLIAAVPIFMCSGQKICGLYLDKFIAQMIKTHFIYPKVRKYKSQSDIDNIRDLSYDSPAKKVTYPKGLEKFQ